MKSRQRIRTIISGQAADRCGFWLGNPHPDTWPIYHKYFRTSNQEELRQKLGDDFRWISPQFLDSTYRHPEGKAMFDLGFTKEYHGQAGPFAHCKDISEVHNFEWPNPDYLNFDECIELLKNAGEYYRASGFWTCFFHDLMNLFGMEDFLINMYKNPGLVHAVAEGICTFYYEANQRFFEAAGDLLDGFFFGNDFGTQLGPLCSPEHFDQFIMPWFRKFTEQAHQHGYQVILHSCGSIYEVIDRLIDARVDCLHPLQAMARNMDAETLARDFKGQIAFMGGIDTQQLLVEATCAEVMADVQRVKEILGPCLIVSPSHEALLPNVPAANIEAMAKAVVN